VHITLPFLLQQTQRVNHCTVTNASDNICIYCAYFLQCAYHSRVLLLPINFVYHFAVPFAHDSNLYCPTVPIATETMCISRYRLYCKRHNLCINLLLLLHLIQFLYNCAFSIAPDKILITVPSLAHDSIYLTM